MPWTRQIRSRIRRFGVDTEPPTLPGVFLPRGAYTPGPPRTVAVARTYDVMDLALRCGAQLLARGTAAVDVESAVHAAATTLGLRDVEVDITFNALSTSSRCSRPGPLMGALAGGALLGEILVGRRRG